MLEALLLLGGLALAVRVGSEWTCTNDLVDHAGKIQQDAAALLQKLKE